MQNKTITSHFKGKKKLEESLISSKALDKSKCDSVSAIAAGKSFQSTDSPAKQVSERLRRKNQRGMEDDGFEVPEVVGKRVKLEKGKKRSKEKSKKGSTEGNMINIFHGLSQQEDNISMHEAKTEEKEKSLGSKSTRCTEVEESGTVTFDQEVSSPKPKTELSLKTKSIIDQILKRKSQGNIEPRVINNIYTPSPEIQTPLKLSTNFSVANSLEKEYPRDSTAQSEFKLSKKTIETINQLKTERKNRFERESSQERTRSESSFSLRFKYEDLLKSERELPLPASYKSLLNSFTELDQTLNYYKMCSQSGNKVPSLENIKESIEETYHHKFEYKTFAQILFIAPHFYVYKWEKIASNDYSLLIDIPKDHKMRLYAEYSLNFDFKNIQVEYDPAIDPLIKKEADERKRIFKNLLLEKVNEYHIRFLESINFSRDFNPFELKTWHHEFNLDNVPQVPIFEILEKPSIRITFFEDFIRENDIKNVLVKKAIENISTGCNDHNLNEDDTQDGVSQTSSSNSANLAYLSKYVSPGFLKKLKAKEEAVTISREILEYSSKKNLQQVKEKEIKEIVGHIKTIFLCSKQPSLSLLDVAESVCQSSNGIRQNFSLEAVNGIIMHLAKLFPGWITVTEHSEIGKMVLLNSKVKVHEEVIAQLENKEILSQFQQFI